MSASLVGSEMCIRDRFNVQFSVANAASTEKSTSHETSMQCADCARTTCPAPMRMPKRAWMPMNWPTDRGPRHRR
eukprot:15244744-Alexandrium_andersonii.AAC.1